MSVLTDQVEAQGEKIRDLDLCLDEHREKLNATEEMLQQVGLKIFLVYWRHSLAVGYICILHSEDYFQPIDFVYFFIILSSYRQKAHKINFLRHIFSAHAPVCSF